VVKAKRDLTLLYCDKLAATYRDTKNLIDLNMAELQNILSDEQFDEVYKYLKSGYKIAGKRAASKGLVPFKERPKNFPRRKQPSGNPPPRKIASQKSQARNPIPLRETQSSQNKDEITKLTTLLAELLKKHNN
jgi:hypothetical protein